MAILRVRLRIPIRPSARRPSQSGPGEEVKSSKGPFQLQNPISLWAYLSSVDGPRQYRAGADQMCSRCLFSQGTKCPLPSLCNAMLSVTCTRSNRTLAFLPLFSLSHTKGPKKRLLRRAPSVSILELARPHDDDDVYYIPINHRAKSPLIGNGSRDGVMFPKNERIHLRRRTSAAGCLSLRT